MQKIFLKQKKSLSIKHIKVFVIFLFLILVVIFSSKTRNFFYKIFEPIQIKMAEAGEFLNDIVVSIIQKKEIQEENEKLKEERKGFIVLNSRLKSALDENKILREALDMELAEDFKVILADVTGKDLNEESFIINKGKKNGVYIGAPVITEKRILIGKIIETYNDYSRIMMITHKESIFDAEIQGRELIGALKGNNSNIFLDLIPEEENVQVGDAIITSNLSGVFPANLFVGTIKNIETKKTEPFKIIQVQPFFQIKKLKQVFIIIEK